MREGSEASFPRLYNRLAGGWAALGFSIQGLSLFYYISFHGGQLINALLRGMEKTEPGDVPGRPLYTAHTEGLGSSSPTGSHLSGRAGKRTVLVLSLHCNTAQRVHGNAMSPSHSTVAYMDSLHFKKKKKKEGRNLNPLNRNHTTLNNRKVLSPLSFLESG